MTDPRAVLRFLDELLWVLRRAGLTIATSQAIDVVRAVRAVGFESRDVLQAAIAAVVVTRPSERAMFDRAFDSYFDREPRRTLWEALGAEGFTEQDVTIVRELLAAMAPDSPLGATYGGGRGSMDHLLVLNRPLLEPMGSALQSGFFVHRLLDKVGAGALRGTLALLRSSLADALGETKASAAIELLRAELDRISRDVRAFVEQEVAARESSSQNARQAALVALSAEESEAVRRAVRALVMRLRGRDQVRMRRASRGRIDPHRTLRAARRTGAPFVLVRKRKRPNKAKLMILCDVSESVRGVARFLLELTYAMHDLFAGTRSFVFVSDLGETSALFSRLPSDQAIARAASGDVVRMTHNSNYGRVLRAFEAAWLRDVDRKTTVVVVGDGRTNYQDDGAPVLDAIRARCRALLWLCPESRAQWATGDSAMRRYAPKCTRVLEVRTPADLEAAARLLVGLR